MPDIMDTANVNSISLQSTPSNKHQNITYRGRSDYERTPDSDSFECKKENKTGKVIGITAGIIATAAIIIGGICLHKGSKALESAEEAEKTFGKKIKKGWEELWHKGKNKTEKITENNSNTTKNNGTTENSSTTNSENKIESKLESSEEKMTGKQTESRIETNETEQIKNETTEIRQEDKELSIQSENKSKNLNDIKTPEEALAEFERVSLREAQEFPQNKKVLDDAIAYFEEFRNKDPRKVLRSKNIRFEYNDCTINILNSEGQVTQRMYFATPIEQNYIDVPAQWATKIIHLNPKNGKIRKIIENGHGEYFIRFFDENNRSLREYYLSSINDGNLIMKDYLSKKVVPDKISVYNINTNEVKSVIEYNTETGYPSTAYANGRVYRARENKPYYFDSIISDGHSESHLELTNLSHIGTSRDMQYVLPRYSKNGYIVKEGPSMKFSGEMVLLDNVTHEPVYSIVTKENDLLIKNYSSEKCKTLWIENNEVLANKFDESPKEVLEKMKDIFADLTPDLYAPNSTKTPEIIDRFISALKS